MKHRSLEPDACPVARSLEAAGDARSMLIVCDAFAGKRRFGEFEKSLGVAKNMLTVRLRKLIALGVLERVPAADGSASREYALTEKGRGLFAAGAARRGRSPGRPRRRAPGRAVTIGRPARAGDCLSEAMRMTKLYFASGRLRYSMWFLQRVAREAVASASIS